MAQRVTWEDVTSPGVSLATNQPHRLVVDLDFIESTVALDQFVGMARKRGKKFFVLWMMVVFAGDISREAYEALYDDLINDAIIPPPIRIRLPGWRGHFVGAYNRVDRVIEVDRSIAFAASEGDNRHSWMLLVILVEEFGHFIDHRLRGDTGDSPGDEGSRYAYSLLNLGWTQRTSFEFGRYHHKSSGSARPLVVDWSECNARLDELAGPREQVDDDQDDEAEFFEADRGGNEEDSHHWGHESIEERGLRNAMMPPGTVPPGTPQDPERPTFEEIRKLIYFGNWLRDFSQFIGPDCMGEKILGRRPLIPIMGYLSHSKFGARTAFVVTARNIGIYRVWEHIDCPKGAKEQIYQDDQLQFNPVTLLPRYIRVSNDSNGLGGELPIGNSPRQSASPTALGYVREQLKFATEKGKTNDGYRHLGAALHVIEDYYAHSNYVELCLIEAGKRDPGHLSYCANIFPWTNVRLTSPVNPAVRRPPSTVPPIVTGTFGLYDTACSVLYWMTEQLALEECTFFEHSPGFKAKAMVALMAAILSGQLHDSNEEQREQLEAIWNEWADDIVTLLHWANEVGVMSQTPLTGFLDSLVEHTTAYVQCEVLHGVRKLGAVIVGALARRTLDEAIGRDSHFDGTASGTAHMVAALIGPAQTVRIGVEKYPTHSQVAKDHADHVLHDLASHMAADAVRRVYDAIEYQWRTEDATARNGERVAQIAAELLVHPATVNVPTYHLELARTWALANRTEIEQKLTRTVVLHARQEWLTMKARIDVIIQQVVRSVEGAREVLRELDAWMDRRLAQLEDAANAARAATPARPRTRRPRQRRN